MAGGVARPDDGAPGVSRGPHADTRSAAAKIASGGPNTCGEFTRAGRGWLLLEMTGAPHWTTLPVVELYSDEPPMTAAR